MYPKILHIYGPLYVQSYGACIALALALFGWLLFKDNRRAQLMNNDQFHWLLILGIICGIVGGRVLYFITERNLSNAFEFFEVWYGGFAVLGSVLGILLVIPFFLKKNMIPILPFFDRVAVYAPLLQSISRIGCFLAGCCYGKVTTVAWAVTYTNPACMAEPLGVPLHPTQLYSAGILACIFLLLYIFQDWIKKDGQLLMIYLILMGFERFFVDFFRDDQTYFSSHFSLFSDHQYIALLIISGATLFLFTHCTMEIQSV
jgi:phosphatidylglycerol---prolipoprotein diacylglyceryl transferase